LCLWSGAERVWRTPSTSYEAPLAKRIGGRSRKLRRVLSDFGIDESFAKAAKKMQEHYGFGVTAVAVRKATLESAAKAARRHEQQCAQDYRRLPGKGPANIIAEADGSMISPL
jgi:chemotaxis regulatin CheY-phosphate phosphatase CheZ